MKNKEDRETFRNVKISKSAKYVAGLAAIPLLWYIGGNVFSGSNAYTFAMISFTAGMLAILVLIGRKISASSGTIRDSVWDSEKPPDIKYYTATLLIMLLLPLSGLALNTWAADFGGPDSGGLFGDFSHPAYFILAVLNCLLLMITPVREARLRLLLFYLKAIGFSYILYFFVAFLPILPLGALGLLFYGLGILIWAPVAATVWQGIHMFREWAVLIKTWGLSRIAAVFLIGLMTLPMVLISVCWGDKANFRTAVSYLDREPSADRESVNETRLKRTLKNIKEELQPDRNIMGFSAGDTPILSELYSRFVLDGKVISRDNRLALENLFFDADHDLSAERLSDESVGREVHLTAADCETEYDPDLGLYRSRINLTMANRSDMGDGEYKMVFKLPAGAYIRDYYLEVSGARKAGILADRRAAMFLYNKIVNTRKDPGLLHYIGRNTLELRVFPFGPGQVRKTGFEVIHYEPFDLELDDKTVSLNAGGEAGQPDTQTRQDQEDRSLAFEGGLLLPSAFKEELQPAAGRQPRYYFVLDSSKSSNVEWLISQVEAYADANHITKAEVLFVNSQVRFYTLEDMREAEYVGNYGYNLNLAIRTILDRVDGKDSFPVILAVSDNMPAAILPKDIFPLASRYPESRYYYALNHDLTLTPYSFDDNLPGSPVEKPILQKALDYNGHYVADNGESELLFTEDPPDRFTKTGNPLKDALLLDAMQNKAYLDGSFDTAELVRASFRFGILAPQTAFLVVETSAQERELLDIQEQVLNNNMDASLISLEEPPLLCILLLPAMIFLFRRRRQLLKGKLPM